MKDQKIGKGLLKDYQIYPDFGKFLNYILIDFKLPKFKWILSNYFDQLLHKHHHSKIFDISSSKRFFISKCLFLNYHPKIIYYYYMKLNYYFFIKFDYIFYTKKLKENIIFINESCFFNLNLLVIYEYFFLKYLEL